LINVYYHVTNEGVSKYTNPTDFDSHLSCVLLDGDHTGALSAVTSTSNVTLAADEDAGVDDVEGHLLLLTSGTGTKQAVQVDGYSATTKVAAMAEAYGTLPVTADEYLVVNEEKELSQHPIYIRDRTSDWHDKSIPTSYFPISNSTYGGFELYPVPDGVYGVQQRYYASLMLLDLAGTLYSTLLRRWQGIFTQGVLAWKLKQEDDSRYGGELAIYSQMLQVLKAKDLDNLDLSNLQMTVGE